MVMTVHDLVVPPPMRFPFPHAISTSPDVDPFFDVLPLWPYCVLLQYTLKLHPNGSPK
jgi:hypothetical protein